MTLSANKKIVFLSDFHLGSPNENESKQREHKIISFLDSIKSEAQVIFLVGDIFDFWFEYQHVIPKGFLKFISKLAELKQLGIEFYIFTGNHDLWMGDYFTNELNIKIFHEPQEFYFNNKQFYIGHGDGLGPGDKKYKFMKKIFTNSFCQFLFRWIHPDLGVALASYLSRTSRKHTKLESFLGDDKEWLVCYSKDYLKQKQIDYFVFGHRHLPMTIQVAPESYYINLGDWIHYNSYAEFDGKNLVLKYYQP